MSRRIALSILPAVLSCLVFGGCFLSSEPPPSVILITIDTLRADRIGVYGNGADGLGPEGTPALPTPALDLLGKSGAVFETVYAPFGRTTQSVGTIHTGLHPLRHGADGLGMALPDDVVTLAERFSAEGYQTAAFVSNLVLKPGLGYEQGFDLYANPKSRWRKNSAGSLTDEAGAWLESVAGDDRPFFLWVHYLDPHWPYLPAERFARAADPDGEDLSNLWEAQDAKRITKGRIIFHADAEADDRTLLHHRRLYDAEVAATDEAVGKLLDQAKKRGLDERTIVMVTSDHGESLGAHRYWYAHGEYLYDDTLLVPWIVRAPGLIPPGTRITGRTRLADLKPTLLGLAGFDVPTGLDGMDHSTLLRQGGNLRVVDRDMVHLADHEHLHDENPRRWFAGRDGRWWAIRHDKWKLIRIPIGPGRCEDELYDTENDPGETRNLVLEQNAVADDLRALLNQWRANAPDPMEGESAISDEHRSMLESLGYGAGSTEADSEAGRSAQGDDGGWEC